MQKVDPREQIDETTGQELFYPVINDPKPSLLRNRRHQPHQVGQQLYQKAVESRQKKLQAQQEEIEFLKNQRSSLSRANGKSEKIVKNARRTKLHEIFDKLDADRDGEISFHQMDLSCLCSQLLSAFRPLFEELEQLN